MNSTIQYTAIYLHKRHLYLFVGNFRIIFHKLLAAGKFFGERKKGGNETKNQNSDSLTNFSNFEVSKLWKVRFPNGCRITFAFVSIDEGRWYRCFGRKEPETAQP